MSKVNKKEKIGLSLYSDTVEGIKNIAKEKKMNYSEVVELLYEQYGGTLADEAAVVAKAITDMQKKDLKSIQSANRNVELYLLTLINLLNDVVIKMNIADGNIFDYKNSRATLMRLAQEAAEEQINDKRVDASFRNR